MVRLLEVLGGFGFFGGWVLVLGGVLSYPVVGWMHGRSLVGTWGKYGF